MIALFLSGLVSVIPSYAMTSTLYSTPEVTADNLSVTPAIDAQVRTPESIRVAVYNEANVTVPDYSAHASGLTNNYSEVVALLAGAGYTVTPVTEADILNHNLTLANYDVFVMVNNLPRETIVNLVKEFWLGGGGVLSFNSAFVYLFYYGLLGPEMEGFEGYGGLWQYYSVDIVNVSARHPITKEYQISDTVSEREGNWLTFWGGLWDPAWYDSVNDGSQTILLNNLTAVNYCYGVAIDSPYRGGRVVQLIGDGYSIPTDFDSIIINSVDYLTPRPKAKIAYDFSHQPRLGVDLWDTLATIPDPLAAFSQLRNEYVNHSYTFDKFYPSNAGNFTLERLSKYDVLIVDWPDLNFTETERLAVMNWVTAGGSLMLLGDRTGLGGDGNDDINYLIQDLDMSLGTSDVLDDQTATRVVPYHITLEGCGSLAVSFRNYLVVTGDAVAIWEYSGNAVVAAQEVGSGRVMLFSDANILDNTRVLMNSNLRFGLNTVNWLSASTAHILYMVTNTHYDVHNSPGAEALNYLGLEYFAVDSGNWMNKSLYQYDWNLVVIDAPWGLGGDYYDDVADYIEAGSYLLMNYYYSSSAPSERLWPLLGFQAPSTYVANPTTTYIWDTASPIFNIPIDYGADNFSGGLDYGAVGESLTIFDNATALAGFNQTDTVGNATLVLANDGRTLYNSYLTDQLVNDTDDSTYPDGYELWLDEIAFMSSAWIDHPADAVIEAGRSHNLVWNPVSLSPTSYSVTVNGTEVNSGSWSGSSIAFNFEGYDPATYEVVLTCFNALDIGAKDTVMLTVVDTTPPSLSEPLDQTVSQGVPVTIQWTIDELYPGTYTAYMNGSSHETGSWTGNSLSLSFQNLEPALYNITVVCVDAYGNSASDTVWIQVNAGLLGLDPITLILIGVAVLALVIVGVVCIRRRSAGAAKPKPKPRAKKKK